MCRKDIYSSPSLTHHISLPSLPLFELHLDTYPSFIKHDKKWVSVRDVLFVDDNVLQFSVVLLGRWFRAIYRPSEFLFSRRNMAIRAKMIPHLSAALGVLFPPRPNRKPSQYLRPWVTLPSRSKLGFCPFIMR